MTTPNNTADYGKGKVVHGKLVTPSFRRTVAYAVQSIRLRLGRCMITVACMVGAIAFLTYNGLALGALKSGTNAAKAGMKEPVTGERLERADDFFAGLENFTQERNTAQKRMFVIVLSLLVSFVGITNSMLMSIRERNREIATFKCLGAVNAYVRQLFMLEAMLQGGLGSLLGLVLGLVLHLMVQDVTASFAWIVQISVACLILGIVMTMIASIWPIRAALAMMPIEALRVEE